MGEEQIAKQTEVARDRERWEQEGRPWPLRVELTVSIDGPGGTRTVYLGTSEPSTSEELLHSLDHMRSDVRLTFGSAEVGTEDEEFEPGHAGPGTGHS